MNGIPALAQSVQSQGRGNDTQLVHMTPREVQGLQAIAMAHGGSLTINPKTGLPEAGFLDSILPMLAGAALTIGSGGALTPLMAAGIVGGGTALVTGDLEKGFMSGLGAYGGAGLGQGFSAAGAETLAQPAAEAATATATPTVAPAATTGATIPGTNFSYSTQAAGAVPTPSQIAVSGAPVGPTAAPITPPVTPPVTPPPVTSTGMSTLSADATGALKSGAAYGPSSAPTTGYRFTQAGEGFKGVFSGGPEGTVAREAFMSDAGVGGLGGLAQYGGAAAMPIMMDSGDQGVPAGTPQMIRPYTYDPGRQDVAYRTGAMGESTAEQEYFRPRYTPMPIYRAKEGGLVPRFEKGGVPMLEDGGFVMTKKAVDGMGAGNNKKGQEALKKGLGAIPIKGKGTGTSDSIKTSIAGKVPARVSNGEAYVPKKGVKKAGGTTNMYALMKKAERRA